MAQLNFINASRAGNTSEVFIFQKNVALDLQVRAVAWKVIRYCGYGCSHPFACPEGFEVAVRDDFGNYSPRVPMAAGGVLVLTPTPLGGRRLVQEKAPEGAGDIQVRNELLRGAVDVCIYKGGLLLALKTAVAPGQKVVFQYKPTLFIGVGSDIVQGEALNSAVLPMAATELSLLGIARADIVMTGGGSGAGAGPFAFDLDNVVPA